MAFKGLKEFRQNNENNVFVYHFLAVTSVIQCNVWCGYIGTISEMQCIYPIVLIFFIKKVVIEKVLGITKKTVSN